MFELEFLPEAENELSESYDWYEEQQEGLGDKFYHEITRSLTLIENNPYHYPIKYTDELRSAVIYKFSFVIVYWIDEMNKIIFVTSIFHTSRNPKFF